MKRALLFGVVFFVLGMIAAALIGPLVFPQADPRRMGEVLGRTLLPILFVIGFGAGYQGDPRRRIRATGICAIVAFGLMLLSALGSLPHPIPATGPEWKPDPALLQQLGPEVKFETYGIRSPQGYSAIPLPASQPNQKGLAWRRVDPQSGGASALVVAIIPSSGRSKDPRKEFLKGMTDTQMSRFSNLRLSPIEEGQIRGLPFLRQRWTAQVPSSGETVRGVQFVGQDFVQIVSVVGFASGPDSEQQVSLMEAAAGTLHPG